MVGGVSGCCRWLEWHIKILSVTRPVQTATDIHILKLLLRDDYWGGEVTAVRHTEPG